MTDNGPQQIRYVAGMRGRKGSVYNGGVRVPFYMKYSALFKGSRDIETTSAHIDILPTLADLCQVEMPKGRIIDGKSLLPLIKGEVVDWSNRPLFFYWTRRYPELYNNIALQKGQYKLVGHTNYNATITDFELFDIVKDPFEQNNLVHTNSSMARDLKFQLDQIFHELINSPNLVDPPRVVIGNAHENPAILNRNDAGGDRGIWAQEEIFGKWRVSILEGIYTVKFKFIKPVISGGQMVLETNTLINQMTNDEETDLIIMKDLYLPEMDVDLIPFYSVGGKRILPFWVELEKTK